MVRGRVLSFVACALAFTTAAFERSIAQTAFGVNAVGDLFRFDVDVPASVTTVGNLGFVPEGINFRPSSSTLYAVDIGPVTTQLYTVSISTGAASPVGPGFPSAVAGSYDLTASNSFGFDFNPTTLQMDNSMRIRLVGTNNDNLRLHSSTGLVAGVDTDLVIAPTGASPFVDAMAYINNIASLGGATKLFDMDSRNNSLYTQVPANNGTLLLVGAFGATINNTESNVGFDIYTEPTSVDPTIGGDHGFAVLKRPNAPINGPLGAYLLYDVNLATGQITNGVLAGPAATPFDFVGGFAVMPIPEPSGLALLAACCGLSLLWRRNAR